MINKVQFTPGVEALSGQIVKMKGQLVYAKNDNPAWDAPEGKQYARNMRPRIVLNVRKSDGSTYWGVRTKNAVNITPTAKMRMAIFGGATAVYQAIATNPTLLANIYAKYETVKEQYKTFKSYAQKVIQAGLKNKQATFNFGGRVGTPVFVNNPWVDGGTGTDVTISGDTIFKFALYLCPFVFSVDGKTYGVPDKRLRFICLNWDGIHAEYYHKFNDGSFNLKYGSPMMEDEDEILYNSSNIYKGSTKCMGDFELTNGDTLSTTAPNE